MTPLLLNSLDISKVFLDKVKMADFYAATSLHVIGYPGMMMDSSRPVQTVSRFLMPWASTLPFDGNPTGGGKRQAFRMFPDLALA